MYKQVGKQRTLVTGLGILMKNSNNIKWGVSTADTLLLRALQTDRVTRYTHYAATVQPLSVMMMAALTGAQLLKPLSCKHSPPIGGKKLKKKEKRRSHRVQACLFFSRFTWMLLITWIPYNFFPPFLDFPATTSSESRTPERVSLRYQCWRIPTALHLHSTEQ